MSRFVVTYTTNKPTEEAEFDGTIDQFMLFKFGSRMAMEDVGGSITEVTETKPSTRRKTASAE